MLLILGIFRFFSYLVNYNVAFAFTVFAILLSFLICTCICIKISFSFTHVVKNPCTLIKLFSNLIIVLIFFIIFSILKYCNVLLLNYVIDPVNFTNIVINLNYGINYYILGVILFIISNNYTEIINIQKIFLITKNLTQTILFILFIIFIIFLEILFMFFVGIDVEHEKEVYCGIGSILHFFGLDKKETIARLVGVSMIMYNYGIGLKPIIYACGLCFVSSVIDTALIFTEYRMHIRGNHEEMRRFIWDYGFGLSRNSPYDFFNLCKINELCTFYIGATHIGLPYFLFIYLFTFSPLDRNGIYIIFR